jgi:hypothetical protein
MWHLMNALMIWKVRRKGVGLILMVTWKWLIFGVLLGVGCLEAFR